MKEKKWLRLLIKRDIKLMMRECFPESSMNGWIPGVSRRRTSLKSQISLFVYDVRISTQGTFLSLLIIYL